MEMSGGQSDQLELGSIWKQFLLVSSIFQVADFPKLCILLLHLRLFCIIFRIPHGQFYLSAGTDRVFLFLLGSVHEHKS